jgi:flagellar motility protein MotE (MotC chaperone)
MASNRSVQKELDQLRKEIAGLRQDYARLKGRVKATKADGVRRAGGIREELADTIEAIKEKVASGTDAAADEIAEELAELRAVVGDYSDQAEKTVAAHPLASLAGALAIGFLIGRLGR